MKRWLLTHWDDVVLWWLYVTKVRPHYKRFYREIAEINRQIDEASKTK